MNSFERVLTILTKENKDIFIETIKKDYGIDIELPNGDLKDVTSVIDEIMGKVTIQNVDKD